MKKLTLIFCVLFVLALSVGQAQAPGYVAQEIVHISDQNEILVQRYVQPPSTIEDSVIIGFAVGTTQFYSSISVAQAIELSDALRKVAADNVRNRKP